MDIFDNHTPDAAQAAAIERIRAGAREFAQIIEDNAPNCADRAVARRKVREAMMSANAAVVLQGHC